MLQSVNFDRSHHLFEAKLCEYLARKITGRYRGNDLKLLLYKHYMKLQDWFSMASFTSTPLISKAWRTALTSAVPVPGTRLNKPSLMFV